jgi:HEAT repeat protein
LQSFMPDLPPGTHSIEYSAKLECMGQNPLADGTAEGQGTLSVMVLDTKEAELATVIAELASRLNTTDHSTARSVEEALLVTNSPLVIPYLRPMLWDSKGAVVRALAKFPGNPDAEDIVLGVLRTGRINEALLALSVMEQWKYLLGPEDFESVLARGNSPERRTALRYAESIGSRTLIPAVSAYAEDPDSQVAAEAKRVLDALNAKGR